MSASAEAPELFYEQKTEKSLKLTTTGKILAGATGAVAVALTVITVPFISPALRKHCLPYVPATDVQVRNVLAALKNRTGKLVDLGSGDGRIVVEAARHSFESHGVELNPWLVAYSKADAFRKGLGAKAQFFRRDLWTFSLAPYDNVVIFGVEQMMQDLERKILGECKNGCHVIACRFPLPNLQPQRVIGIGIDAVWVYDTSLSDKTPKTT